MRNMPSSGVPNSPHIFGHGDRVFFLSWASENGRTTDLARVLRVPTFFVPSNPRANVILRYAQQSVRTIRFLRTNRPTSLIIMLPPTPLLLICSMWAKRGKTLVADLHTGFFSDPKWRPFAGLGLRLLRKHSSIVTNSDLQARAARAGVRTVVSHDPLENRLPSPRQVHDEFVLCPVSYANDEPITNILEAARNTPNVEWRLTGRAPVDVQTQAPTNVTFTGFVSDSELVSLYNEASVVVALTTRDFTMQRAGYEALMHGVPQVTSDFPVLRDFVATAGRVINPDDPAALRAAVCDILANLPNWQAAVKEVLAERLADQATKLDNVRDLVFGTRPTSEEA